MIVMFCISHKMASRNVSNNFTVAGRSVYFAQWEYLKAM